MNKIYTWDWKYRLFFDASVADEVLRFMEQCTAEEKHIYTAIMDYYSSFYSVSQLQSALLDAPERTAALLRTAEDRAECIIYTPALLADSLREGTASLPISAEEKLRLNALLERSLTARVVDDGYWLLCETVFGRHFAPLRDGILAETIGPLIAPASDVIGGDIVDAFWSQYRHNTTAPELLGRFGPSSIGDFDVAAEKDSGFAEWWDREISETGKDKLILYDNPDSRKTDDFVYTVLHETYPGHGHFYNSVGSYADRAFDHGAMSLIEGWATYVEWNSVPSAYADSLRKNGHAVLQESLTLKGERRAAATWARKSAQNYSREECLRSLEYATQYIGFLESYYLGALCFEKLFDRDRAYTPATFLTHLKKNTCGELFALW